MAHSSLKVNCILNIFIRAQPFFLIYLLNWANLCDEELFLFKDLKINIDYIKFTNRYGCFLGLDLNDLLNVFYKKSKQN